MRDRIWPNSIHILHANEAINEVRRAEFFRRGKKKRDLIKGSPEEPDQPATRYEGAMLNH